MFLFRTKPTKNVEDLKHTRELLEPDSWSPPDLNHDQIRVILCQDTGDKAKLTLYDSAYIIDSNSSEERERPTSELSSSWSSGFFSGNFLQKSSSAINIKSNNVNMDNDSKRKGFGTINKSSTNTLPPSMNRSSHALFSQRKTAHNIDLIGEMMFGAVPLSYKGMTTKIHFIKSPKPQILLTKLFSINPADYESNYPGRRDSFSSISSDTSLSYYAQGSVINCESRDIVKQRCGSNQMHSEDFSESSDDDSSRIIPTYPSSLFHHGPPILGLRASSISISSTSSLSTSPRNNFTNRRMRRYSQTSMENGIFNPTPLPGNIARLESLATRLDPLNSNNLNLKRSMMYAVGVVITLEENAILEEFIFSHFALFENRLHQLHSTAFEILCNLLKKSQPSSSINGPNSIFNPSNKRFSVSFLPSLILQNEPTWSEAVMRFKTSLYQLYSTPRIQNEKNIFYDPLWAQLGDLYGSIGTPSVMSRIIIAGEDINTVRRILFVLSYFIRCNEVYERVEHMIPIERDVNDSQQSADHRRRSVNLDLSFSTEHLLEVPMPRSQDSTIIPDVSSKEIYNENDGPSNKNFPYRADELFVKSYGRSLMVGYCDTYMSDFVLMGLPKLDEFQESLDIDLKNSLLMQPLSSQDTVDTVSKSVCILGELNRLNCSVLGYAVDEGHIFAPLHASDFVCSMLHRCKDLYTTMGMPAESCLEYIEDHLRILYYKTVMYKKLFTLTSATGTSPSIASPSIYMSLSSNDNVSLDMLDAIGLQESDIPLVKAVNSTF